MLKRHVQASVAVLALVSGGLAVNLATAPTATALPRSATVALIPDDTGAGHGGTLPKSGWTDTTFAPTFSDLALSTIQDPTQNDPLPAYDTAVLYQVCDIGTHLANSTFNSRLTNFVANGGKLIVWDSECQGTDYSQFIFPFESSNPGQAGAHGTLAINENSSLGSGDPTSPYFVDAPAISTQTDAVGDANVFTTFDGNWCSAKQATNNLGTTGPVQTYAEYGRGLVIYLGLDADYMTSPGTGNGAQNLGLLWEFMLRQQWNPAQGLPCSQSASGITLSPSTATNQVGTSHTVTATLLDSNQKAIPGIVVTFKILQGPNSPKTATATSDANGKATFTYTGTTVGEDKIQASATFAVQTDTQAVLRTSNVATKIWTQSSVSPPKAGLRPDAWIKMAGGSYIGNNIYNKTALKQTVKTTGSRGDVESFWVRIYNDGKVKGTFTAKATGSTSGVKIRYFSGGKDVTAAMKSSQGLKFSLKVGHYRQLRVQMTVKQTATIGSKVFSKVTASSNRNGVFRTDAVKAVVTVVTPRSLPSTGARG